MTKVSAYSSNLFSCCKISLNFQVGVYRLNESVLQEYSRHITFLRLCKQTAHVFYGTYVLSQLPLSLLTFVYDECVPYESVCDAVSCVILWELPADWSNRGVWSVIEPIGKSVRKNVSSTKLRCYISKQYLNNWLNKWKFHNINEKFIKPVVHIGFINIKLNLLRVCCLISLQHFK